MNHPNYNKIYFDLIDRKFPERKEELIPLLSKEIITSLELINVHNKIFIRQSKEVNIFNQKRRSYDEESIKNILQYQISNRLNNRQTAIFFNLSRNSITKWKKLFAKSSCVEMI
jgi:stress response protein SCP2